MSEPIKHDRRRFLGTAAMTLAAAQFGALRSVHAESGNAKPADVSPTKPGTNSSFGSLKQINAGVLNVGYAEAGPIDGPAVILLHGWPYDIHSYVDVAPLLASAGHRVIVPYLRGYGTTRFLSGETALNGQQSVLAVNIIALMDALKIGKATIGGYDWGARTGNIIAALWPKRCEAMASVSGYLTGNAKPTGCRCLRRLSFNGGTNIILPQNAVEPATINIGAISLSSFGSSLRPSGTSMMPRSIAMLRHSTTRITPAS